ncbi:MAG TPA: 4-hydroxy-tetrahydrodipicolinate reductase [Candidatus Dormibacteraeota bacterium]|jgi:4-hydroxy-tetrahydrodipicolinate reductase|nr:4-hydroxy-tetrahydrodipicolinate reductase [Candidatus Dormibacteraeota bacterium]
MNNPSTRLRVAVSGARGKVGREIVSGLADADAFDCVAEVEDGDDLSAALQQSHARVLIDFTTPASGLRNALTAAKLGVSPVIGTTGLGPDGLQQVRDACTAAGIGGCVIPNFAVGAVLLMWLAQLAAPYFETAEIIEAHNPLKHDAPSGTALRTAQLLVDAREGKPFEHSQPRTQPLPGTRGGDVGGIAVHSLRLGGVVADQSVIFGTEAQTLALEHRTTSRAVYVPGVLLAVRAVAERAQFFDSLDAVLGLPGAAAIRSHGIMPGSHEHA